MVTPQRIVGTYYGITAMFALSASVIWGVNTLFLLGAGLTILEAFAANAAFTAGMVLFEIPTGVVADTRGRRVSFLFSILTLFAGTIWYVLLYMNGAAFVWWAAASVVLGLGFTFYSGAVEAWFVDAYAAAGGTEELDHMFARTAQVSSLATLLGTVAGGLLGQVDLALPYLVRSALLGLLVGLGYLFMHDLGFETRAFRVRAVPREVASVARASWQHGWQQRPVRLLMMLSFLHMGFMIWGWYAWQPYFLELLGSELIWVAGVIAAFLFLAMMVGNQLVRVLDRRLSRTSIILISTTGLSACMIGVGFAPSFYPAVGVFLLGAVFMGASGPVKQAAMHRLIPSSQRATIVSFDGLMGSAGGVGSQIGLARLAESRGYAAGYILGGAVLALGAPIAAALHKDFRDACEGEAGGEPGALEGVAQPLTPEGAS